MGCVREMVDAIPASFWHRKNLRVLDPCAGNGNFHAYIKRFVPLECLVFNEINSKRISNIKKLFGAGARITRGDFLEYDERDKFDLIVANPPYAKYDEQGNRVSKNHNLSRAFINKAARLLNDDGYLLFIVPDNWMSLSDRNHLPSLLTEWQFEHLNIHGAKKWFPKVGSTFTWFLVKKSPNKASCRIENHYMFRDACNARIAPGADFVPLYYNDVVANIIAKTVNAIGEKQGIETTCDLHRYTKSHLLRGDRSGKFAYKTIHTPTQTVWSSRPHKYQRGWKVFISLTSYFGTFIDNCGMTQSIAFIRCRSKAEAEARKRELDHPLYKFLNDITRYGNFNNIRVLQRFPRLSDVNLNMRETRLIERYWSYHGH